MTKPGSMWATSKQCPFCSVKVDGWELFIHHVGVEHRAVEQFIPTKFKPQEEMAGIKTEMSHICPLPDCRRYFPSERSLLVHLVMSHFYSQMEIMAEVIFIEGCSKCSKCNKIL